MAGKQKKQFFSELINETADKITDLKQTGLK